MATGYTHPVKDGEITDPKDFLLSVARGFGVFIMQRDDGPGLPKKATVSDYHTKSIAEAEQAYDEWVSMSLAEKQAKYDAYVQETKDRYKAALKEDREVTKRYTAMIEGVQKWDAPEIWQNMKEFALKQLTESLEFDTGTAEYYNKQPDDFSTWAKKESERRARSIMYAKQSYAEEVARVQQQNEYTEQLYTSLGLDYDDLVQHD